MTHVGPNLAADPFEAALGALATGLTREQVGAAFDAIVSGDVSDIQVGAFLFGLSVKGETVAEVSGIADSLLRVAAPLDLPGPLLDIVGTGGDRKGMINISTPACVVAATVADQVTVVKHGNRGATTPTGSADVIEAWGIPIELSPAHVADVARQAGITFCFAPRFHSAMRHTVTARRALRVPTVMNILGPLTNPARPEFQLVGVANPDRVDLMSRVLAARGISALVAHGHDGLDKFTLTAPTDVLIVSGGEVRPLVLSPEDVGLTRCAPATLAGSTPAENATRLRAVLDGSDQGPLRDVVILNAAAAAVLVEGTCDDLAERLTDKLDRCRRAIADGSVIATLDAWQAAAATAALSDPDPASS